MAVVPSIIRKHAKNAPQILLNIGMSFSHPVDSKLMVVQSLHSPFIPSPTPPSGYSPISSKNMTRRFGFITWFG